MWKFTTMLYGFWMLINILMENRSYLRKNLVNEHSTIDTKRLKYKVLKE